MKSNNAFEYIRQHADNSTAFKIAMGEAKETKELIMAGKIAYLLKMDDFSFKLLSDQRELTRKLISELLYKYLYTQEQYAGTLIELANEFGVGCALLSAGPTGFDNKVTHWYVDSFTPEHWGVRTAFHSLAEAEAYVKNINEYGDFTR